MNFTANKSSLAQAKGWRQGYKDGREDMLNEIEELFPSLITQKKWVELKDKIGAKK